MLPPGLPAADPPCPPPHSPSPVQPRWEQEDAHDFLEYVVDRMHLELLALARGDTGGLRQRGRVVWGWLERPQT